MLPKNATPELLLVGSDGGEVLAVGVTSISEVRRRIEEEYSSFIRPGDVFGLYKLDMVISVDQYPRGIFLNMTRYD